MIPVITESDAQKINEFAHLLDEVHEHYGFFGMGHHKSYEGYFSVSFDNYFNRTSTNDAGMPARVPQLGLELASYLFAPGGRHASFQTLDEALEFVRDLHQHEMSRYPLESCLDGFPNLSPNDLALEVHDAGVGVPVIAMGFLNAEDQIGEIRVKAVLDESGTVKFSMAHLQEDGSFSRYQPLSEQNLQYFRDHQRDDLLVCYVDKEYLEKYAAYEPQD